jgi:hypothetical protein
MYYSLADELRNDCSIQHYLFWIYAMEQDVEAESKYDG